MPNAQTLQYAIPLCFAPRMQRNGQHGVHYVCYSPLRYEAPGNVWHCTDCASSISGHEIVARRWTFEQDLAA